MFFQNCLLLWELGRQRVSCSSAPLGLPMFPLLPGGGEGCGGHNLLVLANYLLTYPSSLWETCVALSSLPSSHVPWMPWVGHGHVGGHCSQRSIHPLILSPKVNVGDTVAMLPKSRRALTIQEIAALARSSLHGMSPFPCLWPCGPFSQALGDCVLRAPAVASLFLSFSGESLPLPRQRHIWTLTSATLTLPAQMFSDPCSYRAF